uniref:Uncharacterized protein n=1 Tax=Escherichia coli TaxID=562 RepID=Q3L7G6_ECOLX|nr:hypothetical protein O2ColV41 [Escherichia coli]
MISKYEWHDYAGYLQLKVTNDLQFSELPWLILIETIFISPDIKKDKCPMMCYHRALSDWMYLIKFIQIIRYDLTGCSLNHHHT